MIKAKAEKDTLQRQTEVQQLLSLSPSALPGAIKPATVLQQVPSFGIFGRDVSSVGLRHVLKCVVGMKISVTQQIFHS